MPEALLTGDDFLDLFRTFTHSVFRLEVRDRYYEQEQLSQYLAGGPVDLTYMNEWLALVVKQRVMGKRFERVRVVSKPFTDYTRYGLWLCQYNTKAGEDIRYLDRPEAVGLPDHDYWLIDGERLYVVRFTEDDELLGAEPVTDPSEIVRHAAWRETAWHLATPYDEYLKAQALRVQHPTST